jgi:hypothetical protein
VSTADPVWVAVLNADGPSAIFSGAGQLLHGDEAMVDRELVCVVEHAGGRLELLNRTEFLHRVSTARDR